MEGRQELTELWTSCTSRATSSSTTNGNAAAGNQMFMGARSVALVRMPEPEGRQARLIARRQEPASLHEFVVERTALRLGRRVGHSRHCLAQRVGTLAGRVVVGRARFDGFGEASRTLANGGVQR